MGAPLHCYTFEGGSQIRQTVMGGPNDIVVSRLRLKTPTDCIPHTYWMYRRCLSIFTCCAFEACCASGEDNQWPGGMEISEGNWDLPEN